MKLPTFLKVAAPVALGATLLVLNYSRSEAGPKTPPPPTAQHPRVPAVRPGDRALTCNIDKDCPNENCVDGYCCDDKCEGHCRSCALPGHLGVCTSVPDGQDPRKACQRASGGHPACTAACQGGQCTVPDKGARCGLCSACDGAGRCNVTPDDDPACSVIDCSELDTPARVYDDLTSRRCAALGSCKKANDPGACQKWTPVSAPTSGRRGAELPSQPDERRAVR